MVAGGVIGGCGVTGAALTAAGRQPAWQAPAWQAPAWACRPAPRRRLERRTRSAARESQNRDPRRPICRSQRSRFSATRGVVEAGVSPEPSPAPSRGSAPWYLPPRRILCDGYSRTARGDPAPWNSGFAREDPWGNRRLGGSTPDDVRPPAAGVSDSALGRTLGMLGEGVTTRIRLPRSEGQSSLSLSKAASVARGESGTIRTGPPSFPSPAESSPIFSSIP